MLHGGSGGEINVTILVLAGAAQASFALPMKHFRGWRWEHVWVGQALTSNLIFPMVFLAINWPQLRIQPFYSEWQQYNGDSGRRHRASHPAAGYGVPNEGFHK